jgi:uncharacterized protein YjbI with pentapeptide repeats
MRLEKRAKRRGLLRLKHDGDWFTVQRVGLLLLILAIASAVLGYAVTHPEGFTLETVITDFYANVTSELLGIAVTVLIIDSLNRRREQRTEEQRERDDLIRQFGSRVNEAAVRASEMLRARGWLLDGTLQERDLRSANLEGAKLWKSDLQGADLQWATLNKANLNGASLIGASLVQASLIAARLNGADLRGANCTEARLYRVQARGARCADADFTGAHLENARLYDADLRGAKLSAALFDGDTVLPDGTRWTPETDLARFTDPAHPAFFDATARRHTAQADADGETDGDGQ